MSLEVRRTGGQCRCVHVSVVCQKVSWLWICLMPMHALLPSGALVIQQFGFLVGSRVTCSCNSIITQFEDNHARVIGSEAHRWAMLQVRAGVWWCQKVLWV